MSYMYKCTSITLCEKPPYRAPAGRTEKHHRPAGSRTDSPPPSLTDGPGTQRKLSGGRGTDLRHEDRRHEIHTLGSQARDAPTHTCTK